MATASVDCVADACPFESETVDEILQQDAPPLHLPSPQPAATAKHAIEPALAEQCAKQSEPPVHVAMVPYPLQSQINPLMQFAKALIATHNVIVSFVNIKHYHDRIQDEHFHGAREQFEEKLRLLCVEIEGIPPGRFDFADIIPQFQDFHAALSSGMQDSLKRLFQSSSCRSPPLSCVCFGSVCSWAKTAAEEVGLPSFFFWTQSATVFSMYYHTPLLQANGFFPYTASKQAVQDEDMKGHGSCHVQNLISYVPGVPPLHPSRFPTLLHVDDTAHPQHSIAKEQFAVLPGCQGVIINTFEELEKDCCQALQGQLPFPISFVGPLLPSACTEDGDQSNTCVGASFLQEKVECIEWLNHQKRHSVLYVAFGSIFRPSAEDAESLANGIKASKQSFLWVMRPTSSVKDVVGMLPKGFIDDTKGQGLVIPWAPQLQVLSHSSVGAFLTHCGWNSTIESVSMGVPIIAFPFLSDQPTNAAYLCEFWKVGVALTRQDDGILSDLDVERAIRRVFGEGEGIELRKQARGLREAARRAARRQRPPALRELMQLMRSCKRKTV